MTIVRILGSKLNKIGEGAFLGCSGLKSIIIPENVIEIVQDAFMDCTGLEKVEFKGSLEILNRREFAGCTSLKTIVFPKNLKSIGAGCFHDCDALTDITIPEGVEAVYGGAFALCDNLKSISLPSSLTTLSYVGFNNTFFHNPALQKFTVATGNTIFASYDGCIYNKALTELLFVPTGKKTLIIPESVIAISQYAFFNDDGNSNTNDDGYSGNSIHFRGNMTSSFPENVFSNVTTTAYYPAGNSTWLQSAREKLGGTIVWKEWHPYITDCTFTVSPTSYTYDAKEKRPTVTVKDGTETLVLNTDYTVLYTNNINAGKATVKINGKNKYSGTKSVQFTISKASPVLKFASNSVTKKTTDVPFTNTLTKTTDGTISFNSSKTSVATVDSSGKVTIKGEGTTTITANAAEGTNYKADSASYTLMVGKGNIDISGCTVTLSSTSYTYDGKEKTPTLTVKDVTKTLTLNTDYTVAYENNTNVGKAPVRVTGKGNYTGTKTVEFTINKADPVLKFASASVTKKLDDAAFTNKLTKTTDGTVKFKSSKTNVATVNSSGKVTIEGVGTTTITATSSEGANYKSGSASYSLTVVQSPNNEEQSLVMVKYVPVSYVITTSSGTVTEVEGTLPKGVSFIDASTELYGVPMEKGEFRVSFVTNKGTKENCLIQVFDNEDWNVLNMMYEERFTDKDLDRKYIGFELPGADEVGKNIYSVLSGSNQSFISFGEYKYLKNVWLNGQLLTKNTDYTVVEYDGDSYYPGATKIIVKSSTLKNKTKKITETNLNKICKGESSDFSCANTLAAEFIKSSSGTVRGDHHRTCSMNFYIVENATVSALNFSDVQDSNHAYYKAIYWAADAGITKGYSDGTFGINRSCTRGEMIMFLWRYAGKPAAKAVSKSPFKDVPVKHVFYKAILWAFQKGITKGYPDGAFGINRNVSRGECMMFLWRLKGKPVPKTVSISPFKDVPKSNAFYNAILWGYQKKITTGYTSGAKKGTFGIDENCTRGAIVTFLYRAR